MKKIRVFMVDDHPIVRTGIRMLLEKAADIEVIGEAGNGENILALMRQLNPDVLLLDMEMPGKDGAAIMREVREAKLDVSILVLSAHDDKDYILNLITLGVSGYLTKEEAIDTIVDAVRGVAKGEEGWLSRRAAQRLIEAARTPSLSDRELTKREAAVLKLLARGWSNNKIAAELSVSERTVRFHLTNIYDKLQLGSRAEAISWALTHHA